MDGWIDRQRWGREREREEREILDYGDREVPKSGICNLKAQES
jgi:hypothetical protein